MNIEGYPKSVALVLIKNTLKRWLDDNPGFGILIDGPVARAPYTRTTKYLSVVWGGFGFVVLAAVALLTLSAMWSSYYLVMRKRCTLAVDSRRLPREHRNGRVLTLKIGLK